MQTLTTDQLQQVEDFLVDQYAMQVDEEVRGEVLDHIACAIEEQINQGQSYKIAFMNVFNQWHPHLHPSRFNGYQNIPRFIARRLIKNDLLVHVGIILSLSLFLSLLGEVNYILTSSSWGLLLFSWLINQQCLHQVKHQQSFSLNYYKKQLHYLNYLNVMALLVLLILLGWMWDVPTILEERAPTILYTSCFLFAVNTYLSYRLYQFRTVKK